jgi:hypothetical protein
VSRRFGALGRTRMAGKGDDGDGLVHIDGTFLTGFHTLCGWCDVGGMVTVPDDTPVDCQGCREIYERCRATPMPKWAPSSRAGA